MSAEDQMRSQITSDGAVSGQQKADQPPPVAGGSLLLLVVLVVVIAVGVGFYGVAQRKHSHAELVKYTDASAPPPVSLVQPTLQPSAHEIVMPGNMQAFSLAPIYARTTGYVKAWYRDIGTHVKKGELLAVIETPELDQQLASAQADLATSKANAGLAKITADRYKDLIGSSAVSQQDTDNAVNLLAARNTEVASAEANVRRLEELQSFERIEAPFDGVITARNLDVGQLISATGSTNTPGAGMVAGSKEIFDLSAINTLRVFVNVPQIYAPDAKNGVTATLTLPQYPGRSFTGKLVRTSNAVDPATRTLLAEVDVENKSGELLPGSYTEVHLNVSSPVPALIVPVTALILQPNGMEVATVDANHHVHMVHVTPGRDFGNTVEILAGLTPGQSIVPIPPDSLMDGEEVRVVSPAAAHASGTQVAENKR
jgi:RND family efflux transporter MFP subunit